MAQTVESSKAILTVPSTAIRWRSLVNRALGSRPALDRWRCQRNTAAMTRRMLIPWDVDGEDETVILGADDLDEKALDGVKAHEQGKELTRLQPTFTDPPE